MSESREGCCVDWPKPCPYHEGWQDAMNALADAGFELTGDGTVRIHRRTAPPPATGPSAAQEAPPTGQAAPEPAPAPTTALSEADRLRCDLAAGHLRAAAHQLDQLRKAP